MADKLVIKKSQFYQLKSQELNHTEKVGRRASVLS